MLRKSRGPSAFRDRLSLRRVDSRVLVTLDSFASWMDRHGNAKTTPDEYRVHLPEYIRYLGEQIHSDRADRVDAQLTVTGNCHFNMTSKVISDPETDSEEITWLDDDGQRHPRHLVVLGVRDRILVGARGVEPFGGAIAMRFASLLVATLSLVIMQPTLSHAATAPAPGTEAGSVETNDTARPHCGRHARYVQGHRSKDGQWIKGYCTPIGHH
jgi:hypothetical protein